MKKILFFNSMLTPKLITFLYWVLLALLLAAGVVNLFSGYGGVTLTALIKFIATVVLGAILIRVWCELLIVLFKINDNLQKVADKSEEK